MFNCCFSLVKVIFIEKYLTSRFKSCFHGKILSLLAAGAHHPSSEFALARSQRKLLDQTRLESFGGTGRWLHFVLEWGDYVFGCFWDFHVFFSSPGVSFPWFNLHLFSKPPKSTPSGGFRFCLLGRVGGFCFWCFSDQYLPPVVGDHFAKGRFWG